MDFKSELLKSIWYAFTSLDAERCGKVSKSQLKVLSHNLYTVLNIPHDPAVLEEHFQDDDHGPVSNHGYMPYLNTYILAKAKEGTFNKEMFDELCWMMTSKKNYKPTVENGLCSGKNSFKLFCLFNLLSEDRYPLIMIPQEVEYLLKKISTAMNVEWDGDLLEDLLSQEASVQDGVSVWDFLEFMDTGRFIRIDSREAFSLALDEVFMEMYHNVLKKGYMLKKGHVRKNWQERWFVLKSGLMEYYVGEELREKRGEITLDQNCVVEALPDREGKRCLFCIKTPGRTYEMSASDLKQRVEWIQATQTALRLTHEGKISLHGEQKLRRREQRESSSSRHSSQTEEPVSQEQNQDLQNEIDSIIQHQKELDKQRREKEHQEKEQQLELQRDLEQQLEEVKKEKQSMVSQMAQMEEDAKQQQERIEELVLTQKMLEKALNDQIETCLEEENKRKELERRLSEEQQKAEQLRSGQENTERSTPKEKEAEEVKNDQEEQEQEPAEKEEEKTASLTSSTISSLTPPERWTPPPLEKPKSPEGQRNKQWNVHLTRLMTPITPGDRSDHRRVSPIISCPIQGEALTSNEFITKFQATLKKEKVEEDDDDY
ncbi:differentially expressed in FDCP 6 homolog [Sardina pilchardus]|uniref:differentially expressed in FDCP 6 homolog n=1 Tax=Sardina pilchardus TaxID=27697 RepID=UPI002E0EEE07